MVGGSRGGAELDGVAGVVALGSGGPAGTGGGNGFGIAPGVVCGTSGGTAGVLTAECEGAVVVEGGDAGDDGGFDGAGAGGGTVRFATV